MENNIAKRIISLNNKKKCLFKLNDSIQKNVGISETKRQFVLSAILL